MPEDLPPNIRPGAADIDDLAASADRALMQLSVKRDAVVAAAREARLRLEELVERALTDEDLALAGAAHMKLTTLGLQTQDLPLALAHWRLALRYFDYLDDWQGRVQALNALISVRTLQRKWELVESAASLASQVLASGDVNNLCQVLEHAALSMLDLDKVESALQYFDASLEATTTLDPQNQGWRAFTVGASLAAASYPNEASRYFLKAASIFREMGDSQLAALAFTRGTSNASTSEQPKSVEQMTWAIRVADSIDDRALAARARLGLARILDRDESSRQLLDAALADAEEVNDTFIRTQIEAQLAHISSPPPVIWDEGHPMLVIISGPSGVGKDTIIAALQRRHHLPEYHYVVTCTTREPRYGEIEGVSYQFMTTPQFMALRDAGELLEANEVHANWYGTPRAGIREAFANGQHAILKIDVQGAQVVKSCVPEALLIFVIPPSMGTLVEHLKARRTESAEQHEIRERNAAVELARQDDYDYVVVNDEGRVDVTAARIEQVINREERLASRRAVTV